MAATRDTTPRLPADTFGSRLVLIRHDMGVSTEKIAALCGVKASTWNSWEQGRSPRNMNEVVSRIATATGYDPRWIMWGLNEKARSELLVTSNRKKRNGQNGTGVTLTAPTPRSENHPAVRSSRAAINPAA